MDLASIFSVIVTDDLETAQAVLRQDIPPGDTFPFDRQSICPVNRLVSEVNQQIQCWHSGSARFLGYVHATTDLITPPRERPGLSECQQLDFIERIETADVPLHCLSLFKGNALALLRNLNTRSGLARGRQCSAREQRNRTLVVEFDEGSETTLGRMPMEKVTNGMRFPRWQIPVKLVFVGTVHRSQITDHKG
jgi:hypothetical protein